ncbi:hypothetical protein AgCh_010471 [Apium graveolens]
MVWHAVERKKDGKLRHPADGEAWKTMDAKYPEFSSEPRNVRLGTATDGFNPFHKMSATHITWPIVVVTYNLPPWLNMKPENLILSTIIPGPNDPGNNIDVYMQPLIEELKELWKIGVETYDAATNQKFTLRASVLWTIYDFPGYAMMLGWSTKGKLACPVCRYEISSMYLKHSKKLCYMNHRNFLDPNHKWIFDKRRFNGEVETGTSAPMLTGRQVAEIIDGYENSFGGVGKTRKVGCDINPWNKKSIFFDLPYWKDNLTRHNLDVIHIEKNICDSVLGTLLNIGGKTKDHLAARLDLQDQGIRKALHPMPSADGKHLEFRAAKFDMTNREKEIFCSVLENVKFPYGFSSNISKCVQDRKVTRYKSHDAHVIMQYLLQFAVKGSLKPKVAVPLIRLGEFFRCICSKVIELDEIKRLQEEIIEIVCQLENVLTNPFFDIMVHLPVHLCKEIQYDGPVQQRWMYFIERYLGVLKKYVRIRSKPEGSIAEGYLAHESLTFCASFLNDDQNKSVNESPSVNAEKGGYAIGLGKSKYGKDINLGEDTWIVAHRYILFNYDDKEVEDLIEKHHKLLDSNLENIAKSKRMGIDSVKVQLHHSGEFMKTRYSGGKVETFYVDRDRLSYCEMMDYVKELNYKEIGGLYVNRRGWTLVTDDQGVTKATRHTLITKGLILTLVIDVSFYIDNTVDKSIPPMNQMEPLMIIRPRSSPFKVVEKNVDKRTFVTLKDINNEKERRKSTRKKLKFNTYHDVSSKYQPSPTGAVEPSPKAAVEPIPKAAVEPSPKCVVEKSPEVIVKDIDGSGTGAGQIAFLESGGSREMLKEVEGDGCNEYEMRRNKNVSKNKAKLQALGLCRTKPASETEKRKAKQPNEDGAESDYIPDNDQEAGEQSDHDEDDIGSSKRQKKTKKQRVIPSTSGGPRTRGQANKLVEESQNKEPTMGSPNHVDEINETPVLTAKEKLQALKYSPGSMVAYNELRKREKLGIQKEILEPESGTQQVISESGGLGDSPVGEARKRKKGRTKMNHVHNSTEKKVITLNDQFQPVSYGGKWSLAEFSNFLGTTLKQFVLLTSASWHQVPEKELLWEYVKLLDRLDKLPVGIDDDEMEELLKVSDVDVYLETHKRDDKRSYKLPDEMAKVINKKIASTSSLFMPGPKYAIAHGDGTLAVHDYLTRVPS